tara:strand:+ start:9761 stop:10348 length:588 start_codon:yes stop_codon:yes gene_type:complete
MIRDKNINYKYQSLYLPAAAFDWKPGSADNQDAGDGNEDLVEVGTTGFVGWKFDGGDDQVFISMPTPTSIDWDNNVFYRVIWAAAVSNDLTATESFALSAAEVAFGAAPATSAPAAFATVSDTPSAINVPLATPWAKADSSTTDGIAGTSDVLRIFVDCTTDTANDPRLIGLELKYLPKLTPSPQTNDQADPTDA